MSDGKLAAWLLLAAVCGYFTGSVIVTGWRIVTGEYLSSAANGAIELACVILFVALTFRGERRRQKKAAIRDAPIPQFPPRTPES